MEPVPSWINLDAIVPPDLREKADTLIEQLQEVQETLATIIPAARLVLAVSEEAEREAVRGIQEAALTHQVDLADGVMSLIGHLSGARARYDALQVTSDMIDPQHVLKHDPAGEDGPA